MKYFLFLIFIIQFTGCYNIYGLALNTKKTNLLAPTPHINYKLEKYTESFPESIILIISDGTGIGQYTVSYYANGEFAPARFDHIGLVATHPNSGQCSSTCRRVTDSAASGTALSAGFKTYNGAIGVSQDTLALKTIIEWAEEKNMSTGLVATSTITHATPASFGTHVDSRKKQYEIARQYAKSNIDVLLGGGKRYWSDSLIVQWKNNGGQFIDNINDSISYNQRLLGLFSDGHLNTAQSGRNPTTTEMARLALDVLDTNPNGYFVMIEESQVDWGGHANSAEYIQSEMQSLNNLINFVLDYQQNNPNVLVVLTADHECGGVAVHDGEEMTLDVRFTSNSHSANFVPIWAKGPGGEVFDAFMDNTEIGRQLIEYIQMR